MGKKKVLCAILALSASCSVLTTAMAKGEGVSIKENNAQQQIIVPYYLNVTRAEANISASGSRLQLTAYIKAKNSSMDIDGTLYVEERIGGSWSVVDSWSISGTGILSETEYYYGDSGSTYRSRVEVSVEGENIEVVSASCRI